MLGRALITALVVASTSPADAQGPPPAKLLAVLELANPAGLPAQETSYLTGIVRGVAARVLPRPPWRVMDRANIQELLGPETTLEECVGECEVETGRKLGADLLVTGEVVRFAKELRLVLKLYDTQSSALLTTETVSAVDVAALEGPLQEQAARLFASAGYGAGAARKTREGRFGTDVERWDPAAVQKYVVRFESDPPGAVVLVDGALACKSTPCTANVTGGSREVAMSAADYQTRKGRKEVARGTTLRWRLEPSFALLTVVTKPPGIPFAIDGKINKVSPKRGVQLEPGLHEVTVQSRCWHEVGEKIQVAAGDKRQVVLEPVPREGALDVEVTDANGQAVEALLEVDGRPVGQSPARVKASVCAHTLRANHAGSSASVGLAVVEKQIQPVVLRLDWSAPGSSSRAPRPHGTVRERREVNRPFWTRGRAVGTGVTLTILGGVSSAAGVLVLLGPMTSAMNARDAAYDEWLLATTDEAAAAHSDDVSEQDATASSMATLGYSLIGGGAALAVTGAALWYFAPPARRSGVSVLVLPDGVVLGWTF